MIFVANWKMHGNFNDISKVKTVLNLIKNKKYKKIKIIYCPPFTLLKSFSNYFKNTKLYIGAQNQFELKLCQVKGRQMQWLLFGRRS
jgi:triosephosphate isomerase